MAAVRGHVTLVLDTCFSGGLIKSRNDGGFERYDGMEYQFVSKALPADVVAPETLVQEKTPPPLKALPFTLLAAWRQRAA